MNNTATQNGLRRELRFSRSKVERNLAAHGLQYSEVKPLLEALVEPNGLLGLYGSELLLLEKALGFGSGVLAVDLVGELLSVKRVPASTGVSYGYLGRTEAPTNLGLVAIGFSDGIPRSATNQFQVTVDGTTFPGIGRIAMDQCVIDLGEESPERGSEVSFFGPNHSLEAWAKATGFTPLEIFGRITARVKRTWVA
jgi:alanine racemase